MIGCWIDAAYAAYPDMKSYTGGMISLGQIGVMTASNKQKLNMTNSMKSGLIVYSNYTRKGAIFSKLFLQGKGYDLLIKIFQYNKQSAMRLEKNCTRSCSQHTRRIDIIYIYIKHLINKGIVQVDYCLTELIITDLCTKWRHGALSHRIKEVVTGVRNIEGFTESHENKECVAENCISNTVNVTDDYQQT